MGVNAAGALILSVSARCVLAPLLSTELPQGVPELRGADVKRFFKNENEVNPQLHLNKCSFLIIYIIAYVKMDVCLNFLLLLLRHSVLLGSEYGPVLYGTAF